MIRSRITTAIAVFWFLLADLWLFPGHANIHFPDQTSQGVNTALKAPADCVAHRGHHPEDCQICKLNAQMVSVVCGTALVATDAPTQQVVAPKYRILFSIARTANPVRAPPSVS